MNEGNYIEARGILYDKFLRDIKRKRGLLRPIFEAFTNSMEAINILKEKHDNKGKGEIAVSLFLTNDLYSNPDEFVKIEIYDTGVGFDETEFERLVKLGDDRKNYLNKGTGRIQFLHFFDKTEISSIYRDNSSSTKFKKRQLTLSKSKLFLKNSAIIRIESDDEIKANSSSTTLSFKGILLDDKNKNLFKTLSAEKIKQDIILHYMPYFCENRETLPQINIKIIIDDTVKSNLEITSNDIPALDREESIDVYYSKLNGANVEKTSKKETFNLKVFKINQDDLDENALKLISKGEVAKDINLENLLPKDQIDDKRYLFLLSGKYIDERDGDTRGEINILKEIDFKKRSNNNLSLFSEEEAPSDDSEEEILIDDIEDKTNQTIISLYKEIEEEINKKKKNIKKLQNMFLLNPETLKSVRRDIKIGDTDNQILHKVYKADAKVIAEKDAEVKRQIEELPKLNTTEDDCNNKLRDQVSKLVRAIPLQNRTALTRYVARRKLVLELFDQIIKGQLNIQNTGGKNMDEKLLHNLIFQQLSDNTEESNLWMVNEDFIYFKGTSEGQLGKILLDGNTIIKDSLSQEEEEYRFKQEGDAKQKRPDILLFPKEGKCIIIELKAPNTNVSEYLEQINRYASLINNLSKDTFNFHTYYGYLVGENIDIGDIEDNDSDFESAHSLDFIFRPYKRIAGKFGKSNGDLYTEIIKYSTLLERAKMRNKIFIDKLGINN